MLGREVSCFSTCRKTKYFIRKKAIHQFSMTTYCSGYISWMIVPDGLTDWIDDKGGKKIHSSYGILYRGYPYMYIHSIYGDTVNYISYHIMPLSPFLAFCSMSERFFISWLMPRRTPLSLHTFRYLEGGLVFSWMISKQATCQVLIGADNEIMGVIFDSYSFTHIFFLIPR